MRDVREALFRLIDQTLNLDWLLVTKRPQNVAHMWPVLAPPKVSLHKHRRLDNVWLGVSVSDQRTADEYVPWLLNLSGLAPVLFLSIDPLLGPVTLADEWLRVVRSRLNARIDWVTVTGESGNNARQCNVDWIRDLVRQCREARVPCFVRQLGSNAVCGGQRYATKQPHGADLAEWPEDIRVRELPQRPAGPARSPASREGWQSKAGALVDKRGLGAVP
jgi:protein gp37